MSLKPPILPTASFPTAETADDTATLAINLWETEASPELVTDWGAKINTLYGNGAKNLFLRPDKIFPVTTMVNMEPALNSVSLTGAGGLLHPYNRNSTAVPVSQLVWKGGSGTGTAISMAGDGHTLRRIAVLYDHNSYNGRLIKLSSATKQGANPTIEHCLLGDKEWMDSGRSGGYDSPAYCLLDMNGSVGAHIRHVGFLGAQRHIRCHDAELCDDTMIEHCHFISATEAFISNLPRTGCISKLAFFGGTYGDDEPTACIKGDSAITYNSPGSHVQINDIWYWDQNIADPILISQPSSQTWHLAIRGYNNFYSSRMVFNGPGSLRIEDGFHGSTITTGGPSKIDLGSPSTALKQQVYIENIYAVHNNGSPVHVTNVDGHGVVHIKGVPRPAL